MKNLTDQEKIAAIRSRNDPAIGEVYRLYRNEFVHLFKQRLQKNSDEIYDIYQEAFLEMCNKVYSNKLNESTLTSTLKTYLYGIGKFMLIASNRNGKSRIMELFSDVPDLIEEDEEIDFDTEKIIQFAVNQIGEPCHTLLVKKYWEDKSGEEIAVELNYKNADTVKTQRYKCIQKLKKNLQDKITYSN